MYCDELGHRMIEVYIARNGFKTKLINDEGGLENNCPGAFLRDMVRWAPR